MKILGLYISILIIIAGCGGGTSLVGDRDALDLPLPGDGWDSEAVEDSAHVDDVAEEDSRMDADGDNDGVEDGTIEDASTYCPVWAVPQPTGGPEDGSEARPFAGLGRALERRGTCDTILLSDGTLESPFDAGVDIVLAAGETLTIEGDPATEALAELDAHDDIGLFVTGDGTLILRHLAVRNGWGTEGGCLNAEVSMLRLEETEWSNCNADTQCSTVWVLAGDIMISDSRFLHNDVLDGSTWPSGALCLDGPPDTTHVLVERCRFEDNYAYGGAALYLMVLTRDSVVRDSVFIRNRSNQGPTALQGTLGELSHNRFEANELEFENAIVLVGGTLETRIVHNLFIENRCGRGAIALMVIRGLVANNLFVDNMCRNAPESGWCSAAVWVYGEGNVDLRNNTFVGNDSENGIAHLSYDAVFGQAHSNLFVGGAGRAAVGTNNPEWGVSTEMAYNAWWNVPEPVWGEGVRLAEGNIEADPLFAGGDDFRLGPGSAAIDAGDPDPLLVDTDGSRNDIGAFGGPEGDWTPLPEGGAP